MQVKKVLIIEGLKLMRLQIKNLLEKEDFIVIELEKAETYFSSTWLYNDLGLILLDISLPGMDGFAVLEAMKKKKSVVWPPVIVLSSFSDKESIRRAFLLGARDYIVKPVSEEGFIKKVNRIFNDPQPKKMSEKYSELIQKSKELFELYEDDGYEAFPSEKITQLVNQCIQCVNCDEITVLFNREFHVKDYTFMHGVNVAILSGIIGKWLGVKEEQLHDVVLAGLLHDIGKGQIPRELLNKSGELTATEMDIIKTHPDLSSILISGQNFSKEVLLGVSQHHERMNGSGYPQKLLGRNICLTARIIAVADVYDAMTSNKCYRKAETPFTVIEELFREMFDKLDPCICNVFLKGIKERLVGKVVRLSDGSQATVAYIEGQGFAEPVLQSGDGKRIEITRKLNVVDFIK